jgi:hypothetical protein
VGHRALRGASLFAFALTCESLLWLRIVRRLRTNVASVTLDRLRSGRMGRAASKGVDGAGVVSRAFALRPALLAPATRFRHRAWSCLCPPIQRPSLKHRAVKSSRPPLIDSLPQLSGGERLALAQLQRDDAIAGKPLVVGRRRASGRKRRLMNAIIIEASPFDVDQRRQAFALLAVSLKRDIARLPNGRWEVIVNLGPSDSLKLYGRTRRDTESAIDEFADMMADPRQALGVYAYFRSLAARAEAGGLEIAGDLFRSDGVFNIDAKATDQ